MATSVVLRTGDVDGNLRVTVSNVTFSSSYVTGGEPLTATQLGLQKVLYAVTSLATAGAGGVSDAFYNLTTGTLQAFGTSGEIAATTNLSAWTAQVIARGY